MAKRFLAWTAVLVLVTGGVIFIMPGSRSVVLGYLNREEMHECLPASYYVYALKSSNPKTRSDAAFALGTMGMDDRAVVCPLAEALADADPHVRINAALALYKIGPGARVVLPAIIQALGDEISLVRMDATLTLFRMGPEARSAVPALVEALQRKENRDRVLMFSHTIRQQMVLTLARIGPDARAAVPVLQTTLTDDEPWMRQAAAEALHAIDPDNYPATAAQ